MIIYQIHLTLVRLLKRFISLLTISLVYSRSHPLFHGWGEDLLRSLTHRSHIREVHLYIISDAFTRNNARLLCELYNPVSLIRKMLTMSLHETRC